MILQPAENYTDSQPIKLFEYMAAGLPVIASDFPLWINLVERNECGICVNPRDPMEVRSACEKLLQTPKLGQKMGERGRKKVEESFCWSKEEKTLIALYSSL